MCMCMSPDSRCVPTDYNWCKDLLAPSIDGTVMCIEHHVDGITVYVCSNDDSCYDMPYNVKDLLCLVPLAYI